MDWGLITGAASAVVAICALILSIWQGVQSRRHSRLSFRPHLATWTHTKPQEGIYVLDLINNGTGPAIIRAFRVTLDNKEMGENPMDAFAKVLKILFPNTPYQSTYSSMSPGYVMAPKEKCTVIAMEFHENAMPSKEVIEHSFSRCDLEISYDSFYEENFSFSTREERASTPTSGALPRERL